MNFFENAWFVGISTGIISGVLVFFLTKWIMDKRGKVEYFKQVNNANQNVINALKPYIADNGLPEIEIFEALIASIARSFCIDKSDMFSISTYCEELIREIISDVYVSNNKKQEYTNSLAEYKKNLEKCKEKLSGIVGISSLSSNYGIRGQQMNIYISVLSTVLGMITSFVMVFNSEYIDTKDYLDLFEKNPIIWIPIILCMLVLLSIVLTMTLEIMFKMLKRHRKSTRRSIDEDESDDFLKRIR